MTSLSGSGGDNAELDVIDGKFRNCHKDVTEIILSMEYSEHSQFL